MIMRMYIIYLSTLEITSLFNIQTHHQDGDLSHQANHGCLAPLLSFYKPELRGAFYLPPTFTASPCYNQFNPDSFNTVST